MHGHLVAVEVGIISGANQRVNANRFAFDQLRLKRLDRESMQRRGAIEQDRVPARNFIKNVPNFRRLALNHFLGAAHGVDVAQIFQPSDDERLKQNERHFLGQPALMQLQLRPDNDDGAARIIDAFAEQVLTEPPALTLEHVGK